ncbi:MAG: hypothetical protein ACOCRO_10485 [Halanaerobiales bacterium]
MGIRKRKIYELIEVARYEPVIGAEHLLNIDLPYHQQDMLERAWGNTDVIFLCSRRTGKTFILAVFAALQATLYRNMDIGIVAPVFRQSQTLFYEVEKMIESSPFLRSKLVDEPAHASAEWYMDFTSGSRISALPLSDSIRSKGFNIAIIDEYGYGDNMNNKVKNIIEPMLSNTRALDVDTVHPTDLGNRLFISSTATYKYHDYYKKVMDYKEKINKGVEGYDIVSFDYRDGLDAGIFENERVKEKVNSVDTITKKKEYLNIFPDDDGAYIPYELLQKYCIDTAEYVDEEKGEYTEPNTKIEFEGEEGYEYILTFDDADTRDNFAVSLIKLDGNIKRFVRIRTMNNVPIQEKIKLIREILKNFNVVLIACDQRNKNIKDNLAEPYTYNDGTEGAIILDQDDDEQYKYVKRKYGNNYEYKKLIKVYNFSGKLNETRARHFRTEIEHGKVKFPAPINLDSKKEKDAHDEIRATFNEIVAIEPKQRGKYTAYEPAISTQKKDRWTVSELGVYASDQYRKEMNQSANTDDIVVGIVNKGGRR